MNDALSDDDNSAAVPERGPAGIPVTMARVGTADIPESQIPADYTFGSMTKEHIGLWVDIERDAEPYLTIDFAMFTSSFGNDISEIGKRCYILYDARGCGIGTISAWREEIFRGVGYGRIHWIAIRKEFQGLGLGKTLMTFGLRKLKKLGHVNALLDTQSKRIAAINLYLKYGFLPSISTAAHRVAWEEIRAGQAHPLLRDLDRYVEKSGHAD